MVQLCDTLDANMTARICADGSLVADVRAARVGIQTYLGNEVDPDGSLGLRDKGTVRVYRPEEEVFNKDSMATFAAAPFTIDHPTVPVDSSNWRALGVGEVNGDVVRDGGFVRVPVIVRDSAAVEKVRTSHKQLSMGYSCTLDATPGTAPDGQAYDAVQRNIRINHIAAVTAARGGPELKISDERSPSTNDRKDGTMPHILIVDGLQVPNVSDEAKACIEKLQGQLTAKDTAIADAKAEHDKAIAKLDAKVEELEGKVVDQAQIDALADAKADTVAKAKAVCGDKLPDTAGKTVGEVRRMALDAKGIDCTDKSDDYIEARFDALTADAEGTRDSKVESFTPRANVTTDAAATVTALRTARYS